MDLKQVLASFNLVLLSAACLANPLDQAFEKADTGRLASKLVQLCTSKDLDRLAYCKAYIRGATHLWKYQSTCASLARERRLFCAGAESARTSIQDAISACADCDQPEGLRRFLDELKTGGDICTTAKGRDEHYCAGYNAEVEITIARLIPLQPIEAGQRARYVGLAHALEDVFLLLWGSSEFGAFAPCLDIGCAPGTDEENLCAIHERESGAAKKHFCGHGFRKVFVLRAVSRAGAWTDGQCAFEGMPLCPIGANTATLHSMSLHGLPVTVHGLAFLRRLIRSDRLDANHRTFRRIRNNCYRRAQVWPCTWRTDAYRRAFLAAQQHSRLFIGETHG